MKYNNDDPLFKILYNNLHDIFTTIVNKILLQEKRIKMKSGILNYEYNKLTMLALQIQLIVQVLVAFKTVFVARYYVILEVADCGRCKPTGKTGISISVSKSLAAIR